MQMTNLEELIGAEHTADWRRLKSEEYPDDNRNSDAVCSLDRLAGELPSLNGSDVHKRAWNAFERNPSGFSEVVSEELRNIGFHSSPATGRELVESICEKLEA